MGAAFMADSVVKYLNNYEIQLLHSTPYYAQSNVQAEASNKVILGILRKMLELNPRVWHEELYHTLWAYRTSKRGPTDTTPYALMYGHDVVLPLEINIASLRVQEQCQLLGEDYVQAMWQELEDLDEHRVAAFNNLVLEKQRIARSYDKVTRGRSYAEGQKVWHAVLPLRDKTDGQGKCQASKRPRLGPPNPRLGSRLQQAVSLFFQAFVPGCGRLGGRLARLNAA
ncbi:hypothetical protein ACLB2K_054806 [Fragaria x ananassa]